MFVKNYRIMKKIILLFAYGLLVSCTSDDNQIEETQKDLIVSVDLLRDTNYEAKKILVDLKAQNNENTISYEILAGRGNLNINGQEVNQNHFFNIDSDRTIITYNSSTLGDTKIKFTLMDAKGRMAERLIEFTDSGIETNLPSLNILENNRSYVPVQNNIQSFKGNYKFQANSQPLNINLNNYIIYHHWTRNINGVAEKFSTSGEVGYLVNNQEINYNFNIGDFGQYTISGFYSEIHITDNNNKKSIYTIY